MAPGLNPDFLDLLTAFSDHEVEHLVVGAFALATHGVAFEDAWRDRAIARFDGLAVPVLGLAALRANKAATGRPKDLADLAMLDERDRVGSRRDD